MPSSTVAYQDNSIIRICRSQMTEKNIHAIGIAIRHNQETAFSGDRFYCAVSIAIFPDMVARNRRTYPFFTPTIFRFVDSTKSCFVLKHQTYCGIVETFCFFFYDLFNFFEASIASGLAFFGCLLLGMIFRHPWR